MAVPTDVDLSIIAAFISTFLFGAYLAVSFQCFQILYYRHKAKRMHLYLIVSQSVLFILICLRCISVLYRATSAIVNRAPDGTIFNGSLNSPMSLLVNIPWMMCIVVSDVFLAYRAYIVTKKKLVIIAAPLALVLATTCVGIWLIYSLTRITDDSLFFVSQVTAALKTFCALTVVTNVSCSGLIAWHITSVQRGVAGFAPKNDTLSSLVAIIVESAALWTAVSLAIVVTTFIGSYVNFVLIDMCPPLIGIVFSNIIIRISRGQSYGDTNTNTNTNTTRRNEWSGRVGEADTSTNLQIRLDRIVHTHHEPEEFPTKGSISGNQETSSIEGDDTKPTGQT